MAVAEGDDARAVVAADEAAIANFGLAQRVGFTACGGEFDFVGKAGFGEEGGAGGLAEGDEAFSVELGVDAKSEIGAGGFVFGVLGRLEIEEATFLVKATGFGAVVAGGEGACEGREDVVPSGGVAGVPKGAEGLKAFAAFFGPGAVIVGGVGEG